MLKKLTSRRAAGLVVSMTFALAMLVTSAVTDVHASAYRWSRTLSQGMSGPDVAELQIRVAGWAADGIEQTYVAVDSVYGPKTTAAVKRFQKAYGLTVDGIAGPATFNVLSSLEKADQSTAHFNWSEFYCNGCNGFNGGKVSTGVVKENIRRLMYKLEALRKKLGGNRAMTIASGFRSIAYNGSIKGASNSQHLYGDAADVSVSGLKCTTMAPIAATSGFSGIEPCWKMGGNYLHVDNRIEHPSYSTANSPPTWWWPSPPGWWTGNWFCGIVDRATDVIPPDCLKYYK